ncbi:DUF3667 domain-containing protein [Rhodanobacter sp. L36]|uniref:DUF3667 domain-containing protein n=1 Tax=Rhodanobacter sp. L36 TaxID=1747221 RepID=UPI00131C6EE3|nr:DUF3667 domain-containing protein [Rhodanobacter sp. L36]
MKQLSNLENVNCANCGAQMHGEFCHDCGQSIHTVLRPLHGMIGETVETVLDIDGRIVHTLPPLLLKPGFLTLEYFSGRRVRYVAPFRLMFILCVMSFFVFHLAVENITSRSFPNIKPDIQFDGSEFAHAKTAADVRQTLRVQLHNMEKIRNYEVLPASAAAELATSEQKLQQTASARLIQLGAAPMPAASMAAPAAATSSDDDDDSPLDISPEKTKDLSKSIHVAWLPDVVNARLGEWATHVLANWRTYKHGDAKTSEEAKQRMINGIFGVLPQTMFVLIPMFAGMLWFFYVFRRRLYMEHLIVALHSHAFMFLTLLLVLLLNMLGTWLKPHGAWMSTTLGWLETLMLWWIPIYLLIMQKRVYRQGWAMTVLKWWFIGWFYFWLLLVALLIATVLGLGY